MKQNFPYEISDDSLFLSVQDWPEIRRAQISDLLRLYSDLDPAIPLVCVCGNHDVGNRPTKTTIEGYRADFGDDFFSFWVDGVHCIVLNSQLYEDCSMVRLCGSIFIDFKVHMIIISNWDRTYEEELIRSMMFWW